MTLDELIKEREGMVDDAISNKDKFPTEELYKKIMKHETDILECLKSTRRELETFRVNSKTEGGK